MMIMQKHKCTKLMRYGIDIKHERHISPELKGGVYMF